MAHAIQGEYRVRSHVIRQRAIDKEPRKMLSFLATERFFNFRGQQVDCQEFFKQAGRHTFISHLTGNKKGVPTIKSARLFNE